MHACVFVCACVCVCVQSEWVGGWLGGGGLIAATSPPRRCRLGELDESFHLGERQRMGAQWGGDAEEAKLQSSSAVTSDPPS